ncbi:MAG: proton-conducting transporter membrane subunit [Heliobacteriaceae bacterium]|nr:proton-conducting transporter membrane subunit [Heliobacteriaceae bacterium]MDD4587031.1 proton-conducting transporter membrane subunit [Heliobacteriaceae bacterium]
MVDILFFLVLFPLAAAALLLILPNNAIRSIIVWFSSIVLTAATIYLTFLYFDKGTIYFNFDMALVNELMLVIEAILAIFIFAVGLKYKKYLASILITLQAPLIIWFELTYGHALRPEHNLFLDNFSLIMALIIGIIGSLICVYALGYMKDFHNHHHEMKDKRNVFFFIMFIFLSAMFGLVFSNNLIWLYFFWEITTLCSFLLIGYTKTTEAVNNAFLAIIMNLLGGLAFAGAIVYMYFAAGIIELDKLITFVGQGNMMLLLPVALLSFAGITKAAQMPFSSWLLGAMVAPTPTSALLHSSTMVKAGVYLVVRLAPALMGTFVGEMVALVGGVTFLLASCIAISQTNAKRVLAYSTVANLGLIVACGGIGTAEAVWAAILLIIFHAIAKSLLFLCVGTVEHKIGSRDIEDMDNLIARMPKIAVMMVIGIAGMFLAPFGMLISKWAALKAFIDTSFILVGLLSFGSAATLFFWTKWMGKLIAMVNQKEQLETTVSGSEWVPLYLHAFLTIVVCLAFPLVSSTLIEPYLIPIFGKVATLGQGNMLIMVMMLAVVVLLPLGMMSGSKGTKIVPVYMGGGNLDAYTKFQGPLGMVVNLAMRNYYMDQFFGEKKLALLGVILCTSLFLVTIFWMFGVGII